MNDIKQNHYGKGDNIKGNKIVFGDIKENIKKSKIFSIENFLKYIIAPLIVGVGVFFITTYIISNKNNSMNLVQNHYGSGDNIGGNKYVINPKPNPIILEKKLVGSSLYQSGYKTQFLLTIGFPPGNEFSIEVENSNISLIDQPVLQSTGTRTYSKGPIPYKSYLVSVFSKEKLLGNEFNFLIK